MTSYSPRVYTYKITFEEVPYYYYGVHKEKRFDEYYMGSPYTHKWCWDFYTPKKQILEIFPFTDEGYIEAQEVEKRLIQPVYNTDEWCLNENVGGIFSLETYRKSGKIGGNKTKELGVGVHGRNEKQRIDDAKKGGLIGGELAYKMKVGIHARTKEQMSEDGKKSGKISGKRNKELGVGIFGLSPEQRSENSKKGGIKGGKKIKELGIGIHGLSLEQLSENGKKGGKKTNAQKWECTETAYVTTAGPLTRYQKTRGIDTSKRRRIS